MKNKNHLSEPAKIDLAESEVFGEIPRDELNLKWNRMIMELEKKNAIDFIQVSKEVQSLIVVLFNSDAESVKRKIKAARYCVAKDGRSFKRAKYLLDKARKELENKILIDFSPKVRIRNGQ